MLGIGIVVLEPVISDTVQCLCKPLTILSCHHRGPREANIFHIRLMTPNRGSSINYFNTCAMHLLLFCTMTNKCAIN